MPCSRTHVETIERVAAILQPHFSHYRLSSGPLNSVLFVESYMPQKKPRLSKITEQVRLVIHSNLVLAVIIFYHLYPPKKPFPRNINWVAEWGEREVTVTPTPQPCKWMTYAITVCQHAKIWTICHKFTTHICWHFKMPLQRNKYYKVWTVYFVQIF